MAPSAWVGMGTAGPEPAAEGVAVGAEPEAAAGVAEDAEDAEEAAGAAEAEPEAAAAVFAVALGAALGVWARAVTDTPTARKKASPIT